MSADPSWADLAGSLPTHQDELMASHPGRPTPAESVAMGVTPSSGGDEAGPVGGPIGGGRR